MIIYKITNKITNDFYIGKTTKTKEERFRRHIYNSTYNIDTYLYRAMRKYGTNNFIIEELESQISYEMLDKKEIEWISKLRPKYNMTFGGEGGDTSKSPNFIEAIKKSHVNRLPSSYASYGMLGKKFPEEAKKKVSDANSNPVSIDGIKYKSIKECSESLGWTEKRVRYRVDSPKYPNCFRLKEKTKRI